MPRKPNLPKGDPEWKREWEYQKANGEDKKQKVRAKARAMYDKAGIARPDGMQIDHIKPVEKGGASKMSNLKLIPTNANEKKNLHHKGETKGKK
jgi:hypothetical protein